MDARYFLEEHLWMSASDEATYKFLLGKDRHFHKKKFVKKRFSVLLIYYNCFHIGEHKDL